MPTSPTFRRLLAVGLAVGTIASGRACDGRRAEHCTAPALEVGGVEHVTTAAESQECTELLDILSELRERDPGGNLDLGRD